MSTTYLSGYDLDYRPETYWPDDPTVRVLTSVKGEARRRFVRFCVANEHSAVLDDPLAESSLSDEERQAAGAAHPFFMGGEYLPDLRPREAEIARISMESTTTDVISVRARLARNRIHYRIVDEYDTNYAVSPRTSRQPLSLRQMVDLLRAGGATSLPGQLREMQIEGGAEPEEAVHFASVSSEFYSTLGTYHDEEASRWLEALEDEKCQNYFNRKQERDYETRLRLRPWESPWDFPGFLADDLGPVDAQMLSHWLQHQTGDPRAKVVADAPKRNGEDYCAIEIQWHDPGHHRVRIPLDQGISVATAFSRFLVADDAD